MEVGWELQVMVPQVAPPSLSVASVSGRPAALCAPPTRGASWPNQPPACRHVLSFPQLPGGDSGFSREQLSRLAAPTIVITAEHDMFAPGHAAAEAAAAALPDCKTIFIPGAKHLPSKEKQAELNNWIQAFFVSRGLAGTAAS